MEFKEFSDPLAKDYDITSSYDEVVSNTYAENNYTEELINLIGVLEDGDDPLSYGITWEEYLHPTAETISKVKEALGIKSGR